MALIVSFSQDHNRRPRSWEERNGWLMINRNNVRVKNMTAAHKRWPIVSEVGDENGRWVTSYLPSAIDSDLVLVAALGIDGEDHQHPLGPVEGATENAAVVQVLINNLIEREFGPKVCGLFIKHPVIDDFDSFNLQKPTLLSPRLLPI